MTQGDELFKEFMQNANKSSKEISENFSKKVTNSEALKKDQNKQNEDLIHMYNGLMLETWWA